MRIVIADNGVGIPEDVRVRIFDHLFTTKGVAKGMVLGLAIAQQIIVEKHDEAIAAASKIGTGTKFIMDLLL